MEEWRVAMDVARWIRSSSELTLPIRRKFLKHEVMSVTHACCRKPTSCACVVYMAEGVL